MAEWYRDFQVDLVNGSTTVTGQGTLWQTAGISAGDVFFVGADPSTGPWYEIEDIPSETTLTLKSAYQGATQNNVTDYAIIIVQVGTTNADLAQLINTLASKWNTRETEMIAWQGGIVGGGPNADGTYPLTNLGGTVTYVKSPAQQAQDLQDAIDTLAAGGNATFQREAFSATGGETSITLSTLTFASQAELYVVKNGDPIYNPIDFAGAAPNIVNLSEPASFEDAYHIFVVKAPRGDPGPLGGSLGVSEEGSLVHSSPQNINVVGPGIAKVTDDGDDTITVKFGNAPTGAGNLGLGVTALDAITTGTNNTALGQNSLSDVTEGVSNVGVGANAGVATTTGNNNVAIGANALVANITGGNSVAIGTQALEAATGSGGVAVGHQAGQAGTASAATVFVGYQAGNANTANSTTAVGYQALLLNTTGASNTAVGANTATTNASGISITAVGRDALRLTTGSFNTGIGAWAGDSLTTGHSNTLVGSNCGSALTTGTHNVAMGYVALSSGDEVDFNTAIGRGSMAGPMVTGADHNTALGYATADSLTTGNKNVAVGSVSLSSETSGIGNTAVGYNALASQSGASGNTAVGYVAGDNITTGQFNSLLGRNAGGAITDGTRNVIIGYNSGDTITTGDYNTVIGDESDTSTANAQNEIVIGRDAIGAGNNTVQLGNTSVTDAYVGNGARVITTGDAVTGWVSPTGTQSRATYVTSTVTTEQLAQRVHALIDDLLAAGVISV